MSRYDGLIKRLEAAADWDDQPWWWDCPHMGLGEDSAASLFREAADVIMRLQTADD